MRSEVGSECAVRHLPGSMAEQGAREKALRPWTGPCCAQAKGEGDGSVETGSRALPSSPSWDPEKKETALFLRFWVPLAGEPVAEHNKKGTKDSPPGPPPGEGVVRSPSPEEQDPETPLSCGQLHTVAVVKAAAEAELERRWRQQEGARRRADGGAAAGGGVETAADCRGRICQNTSVCCCAAENCWAKPSTASPNRLAWEIGASKKRCLSDSLISTKVSHRWHSWTTNVDIV